MDKALAQEIVELVAELIHLSELHSVSWLGHWNGIGKYVDAMIYCSLRR